MRKRERENPCGVCGHYHKYEEGEVCGICGHRVPMSSDKTSMQVSAFPSEILSEFLYLGSYDNASRPELLKTQGISRVLNSVPACQNLYKNSFTYHCLEYDKSLPFDDAIQFLAYEEALSQLWSNKIPSVVNILSNHAEQCERDKARVLVHCMSGKNRSPAIVIAYLMKSKGWRLQQSYQWVKERRPSVEITEAVHQQLQEFEKKAFETPDSNKSNLPTFPPAISGTSFTFGFPKLNDPIPIPAFNTAGETSIFSRSTSDIPREFTFGASQQNPSGSDVPMDSS